jgi:Acetyltransferase (GNAT) family
VRRIVGSLLQAAKEEGCYKAILDCSQNNIGFYEKCGLVPKEIQMVRCASLEMPAVVCRRPHIQVGT